MFTINIKNFRSFKNEDFNFSKINILIGENSSGKSSLLKFLLALKQSQQVPSSRNNNFTFKGEHADLGSYKDAVYYQEDSLPIEFSFQFDENYSIYYLRLFATAQIEKNTQSIAEATKNILGVEVISPTFASFSIRKNLVDHTNLTTSFNNNDIGNLSISFGRYDINKGIEKSLLLKTKCNIKYFDKQTDTTYEFGDVNYDKDGFMTLLVGSSLRESIVSTLQKSYPSLLKDEFVESLWNRIAFLVITQNHLNYLLSKIQYINPINTHPTRLFLTRETINNETVKDLNDVVEFLTQNDKESVAIRNEYFKILKQFGIAEEINLIHDERLPVSELRVKIKDLVSNIYDVGYGVALQMPIILKALLAERMPERKNSIIFIEQPEVHLHPKLHAELISILLSLSKKTVYFIETHSEHIVRKLQVCIKQRAHDVTPNDVTIHYLTRNQHKSDVTKHKIMEDGRLIPPFASGFFDNSFSLAKELLD